MTLSKRERRAAIRRLHARGLSDGQIAKQLGISARTVLRIRQELNLLANVSDVA